jgi:hypothetical protein
MSRTTCLILLFLLAIPAKLAVGATPSITQTKAHAGRWLISYKGKSGFEVAQDPRFLPLVEEYLPHLGPAYSRRTPLAQVVKLSIYNDPSFVAVESDRFVTITGQMPSEADAQGLLWFDVEAPVSSAMIFVEMTLQDAGRNGKASLTIYTNRKELSPSLPIQFTASLNAWERSKQVSVVKAEQRNALNQVAQVPVSILAKY